MPPLSHDVTYIGRTNHHNQGKLFGIKQADRLHHMYIIGKTGVGKSTLIEFMARQDLLMGRGFAVIDPHGDMAESLHAFAEKYRPGKTVYFDAADMSQPYGYNPLRRVRFDKIPLAVSGLMGALQKQWPDAWGVRMEHVLRNSLYALLEQPAATLPDILRLYSDEKFRKKVTKGLRNKVVQRFWQTEFEAYPDRLKSEAVAPIQNKLGAILTDPRLYRILVSPQTDIRFRLMMDTGGALIVNLAKGRLGEDSTNVLGGLIVSTIGLAALSRAESTASNRRPFFLYVDEFQTFTTLAFVNMMAELRKYGVGVVFAHQHLHQLEPDVRHATLGNVGSVISFRIGAEDADLISKEFQSALNSADFTDLTLGAVYLHILIDGWKCRCFSAKSCDF